MTQPLALSSSTQNSEKLNQTGFKFPPGVIIPVYLQFNGLISDSDKMIKLFTLNFYEEIVDKDDARISSFKSNC